MRTKIYLMILDLNGSPNYFTNLVLTFAKNIYLKMIIDIEKMLGLRKINCFLDKLF